MLIDCVTLSNNIREEIKGKIEEYRSKGLQQPRLVVIKVGNDFASEKYVKNKEKACGDVGISTITHELPESTTTDQLIRVIKGYNPRIDVNGILVQLPLPKHIDESQVINAITPKKDVDGFTRENVAKLWLNEPCIRPCTPKGIIAILDSIHFKYEGSEAVVIGRSNIVGKPIAKLLMDRGCTVAICHSKSRHIADHIKHSDLVVSAVGKANFLQPRLFEDGDGLRKYIIDVGINRNQDGKVCGDVNRELYDRKDLSITPVPKGVGVMTVTMLLKNTLELYEKQHKL